MSTFNNTDIPKFNEEQISFLNHHVGNIALSLSINNKKGDKEKIQEKIVELIEMKKAIIKHSRK